MTKEAIVLLVSYVCLMYSSPVLAAPPAQGTNTVSSSEGFNILAWPDGNTPGGFMTGLQLVSLPAEQCGEIVANAKPSKAPEVVPDFKTPLAAAQYFGSHLNMGGPPRYMAVHAETNGVKYYLFSGGLHWGKQPLFSEAAVLLETGEIRFYHKEANKSSEAIGVKATPKVNADVGHRK